MNATLDEVKQHLATIISSNNWGIASVDLPKSFSLGVVAIKHNRLKRKLKLRGIIVAENGETIDAKVFAALKNTTITEPVVITFYDNSANIVAEEKFVGVEIKDFLIHMDGEAPVHALMYHAEFKYKKASQK